MSDLRHLPPTDELPVPRPPRRGSSRTVVLIAGLVAVAVVATLVFVLVRPSGGVLGGGPSAPPPPPPLAGEDSSAGTMLGWGEPAVTEAFDKPLDQQAWSVYDGVGHGGEGRRTPDQVNIKDGLLVIDGDAEGSTGGLALNHGQKYGRWEGRVRAPASDETYHALLLLWPDSGKWPEGGEIDFMEMLDASRQETNIFVHYADEDGQDNNLTKASVKADATQWHNWAVEWTPEHIIAYLDGREWFRTTDPKVQPPGPMHLTIQLDWFPSEGNDDVQPSSMEVDWVKQYPYPAK